MCSWVCHDVFIIRQNGLNEILVDQMGDVLEICQKNCLLIQLKDMKMHGSFFVLWNHYQLSPTKLMKIEVFFFLPLPLFAYT